MIRLHFFRIGRVCRMGDIEREQNGTGKTSEQFSAIHLYGFRNSGKHRLGKISRGAVTRFRTDFLAVEEKCSAEIFRIGRRFRDTKKNRFARKQVVQTSGIDPFLRKAAERCLLRIEELHFEIDNLCADFVF